MPALIPNSEEWRATCVEALKLMEVEHDAATVAQLENIAKLTGLEGSNVDSRKIIDCTLAPIQKKLVEVHLTRVHHRKFRVLKHFRRKRTFKTVRIEYHPRQVAKSTSFNIWTFFGWSSEPAAPPAPPAPKGGIKSLSFKSTKPTNNPLPQTWTGLAVGGVVSGAASFLITFLMRYYKHTVSNISDDAARARAEQMYSVVEYVIGGASVALLIGSVVMIFLTGGAAAIPILIGFLASIIGHVAANALCDLIFGPVEGDVESDDGEENDEEGDVPPGFIHSGVCVCCSEESAVVAMVHQAPGRPNEGVAHFAYCRSCYDKHQAHIDRSQRCACCNTPITDIVVYEQDDIEVAAQGGPLMGYTYTGTCAHCDKSIDFTHRMNHQWRLVYCEEHGRRFCSPDQNGSRLVQSAGLEDD